MSTNNATISKDIKEYRYRKPRYSPYYQCIEDNYETFEHMYENKYEPKYGYLRPIASKVIYQFLDYGILHNGFVRFKCKVCGHEYLLTFSCKRRYFCPSCHAKRVVEFREWLCSNVLKSVLHCPILCFPYPK